MIVHGRRRPVRKPFDMGLDRRMAQVAFRVD